MKKQNRNPVLFQMGAILLIGAVTLSACSNSAPPPSTTSIPYSLAPQFIDGYTQLNGDDNKLGAVNSPVVSLGDGIEGQFTQNSLMIFDHTRSNGQFYLAPLGIELGLLEPGTLDKHLPGGMYVNGHNIFPTFVHLFANWQTNTGLPISEPRVEDNTVIQYFENVGLRVFVNDPNLQPELIPYGAWFLNIHPLPGTIKNTTYIYYGDATIPPAILRPFKALTGEFIESHILDDGLVEYIFANMAFWGYPNNQSNKPRDIRPINIVELAFANNNLPGLTGKVPSDLAVVRSPHPTDPQPVFTLFDQFIAKNGGYDMVGFPISLPQHIGKEDVKQCFTNACLLYHPSTPAFQVFPIPMGITYSKNRADLIANDIAGPNSLIGVHIYSWKVNPLATPDKENIIQAFVEKNGISLANIVLTIHIDIPNQLPYDAYAPPTDAKGKTEFILPVLNVKAGQLLEYKVCYTIINNHSKCQTDSILFWISP